MSMSSTSPQASPVAPLTPSMPVEPLPPPPSPRPRLQEREASCLAERALALSNSSRMAATSAASRSSFFPEAMARRQSRSTSSRWSLARCLSKAAWTDCWEVKRWEALQTWASVLLFLLVA